MYARKMVSGPRMTLKDLLAGLGKLSAVTCAHQTRVPYNVVMEAQREGGEPIAESYARKIAAWLSQEYERTIEIDDIKGLKTIKPGREGSSTSE